MRDIKFRAWLLKENKMVIVDTISNNKGYGGALEIIIDNPLFDTTKKKWEDENRPCDSYLNHSIQVHKDRANGDDFILMQYTGLKDKNGAEIYERDIINSIYFKNGIVEMWDFMWVCNSNESLHTFRTATHSFEVIGNIYENPELLK